MPVDLFAVFCTAEIPPNILSTIIEAAYAGSPGSPLLLYLLTQQTVFPNSYTEASQPPVTALPSYPFLYYSTEDIIFFLDTKCTESGISRRFFLIADERTGEDDSLLFVDRGYEPDMTVQTVRLDAMHANAIPIAIQVGRMDIDAVREAVDVNGVYRDSGSGE